MERNKLLFKDLSDEIIECINDEASSSELDIELIQEGDWIDDDKYSFKTNIWKHQSRFWSHNKSKSGSYFTDYEYYDDDYLTEVFPKEKTIIVYE